MKIGFELLVFLSLLQAEVCFLVTATGNDKELAFKALNIE